MGFNLTWGGIAKFGIVSTTVDANGNVISTSNTVINPNVNIPNTGSGGSGGTAVFGFNPTYVHKSKNAPVATQLYYYGSLDSDQYDTATNVIIRPVPFNQTYQAKRSSVTEDTFEEVLELAVSRSAAYEGGAAGKTVKAARLSSIYKPDFAGLYTNRSPLEKQVTAGNSVLVTVTASMDFYNIPTSQDLLNLTIQLNATASAVAAALGIQVNVVMPSADWHGITREPLHPDGPGNYYPYRYVDNNQSSYGVVYDATVEPRSLSSLRPIVAVARDVTNGYWFGTPPVNSNMILGPEDIIGIRYDDGSGDPSGQIWNSISDRRDPAYLFIGNYTSTSRSGMYQQQLVNFLQNGNGGSAFLPTVKPTGVVNGQRLNGSGQVVPHTYNWSIFAPGAVDQIAPKVTVTASINLSAASTAIFTKGTYSHIEVPKVVTTGNEETPSAIICHDSKKIYYFVYSYQDNERCVAYNVLRECEEDDKRTYMPLPTSSIYYTGITGSQNPPPPPPPLPLNGNLNPVYVPNGPTYPQGTGYNKFGFGTQ